MRLKNNSPGIETRAYTSKSFSHLTGEWIAVLRWLGANKIEYVLIGAAGEAIRGDESSRGPVAIIPAPYSRNFDRLSRALLAAHARTRVDGEGSTAPVKMTPEKLSRGTRWTLRCGAHNIDVERSGARGANGTPRYQELLYESGRFELEPGLSVEVASTEDLEHFAHLHRTGTAPEIRITRVVSRNPREQQEKAR